MVFLGLLLALAAITLATIVILDNSDAAQLTVFGQAVPGVNSEWQIFAAGAVVAILFMAGMTAAAIGIARSIRLRQELRDLREEHEESVTTLEMEKRQLQRELARAKQGTSEYPQVSQAKAITQR